MKWRLLFMGFLLAGCSSSKPPESNALLLKAADLNQRGLRAAERWEWDTARDFFTAALKLDRALENTEGIATNTLNLARVETASGHPEVALQLVDELLNDDLLPFATTALASAALQKAVLLTQKQALDEAAKTAEQALVFCNKCDQRALIASVRANIALNAGKVEEALEWSEQAMDGRDDLPKIELANAQRVHAQIRIMRKEFKKAIEYLENTLALDKELGLPEKIRLDLQLLAIAYERQGQPESAARFRGRAKRVGEASR